MKFAVGYRFAEPGEESLVSIVADYASAIHEVYFAWLDMPSGRPSPATLRGGADWGRQKQLEADLLALKQLGVRRNLLLNANCYGGHALSHSLAKTVCSVVEHLEEVVGIGSVTTASPVIAQILKESFAHIEVRASINMRIGTIRGMQYLAHVFDGFYMQREYNRDFGRIEELKQWCDASGKGLFMLANSGCLNDCSGQTFHDNVVAHGSEISEMRNLSGQDAVVCQQHLHQAEHWVCILQGSWVRPEDLGNYEGLFSVVKLATRVHSNPRRVIGAYAERRCQGNLLDLLEPGHGPLLHPYLIDNSRFPQDWFRRTRDCDRRCHACDYCRGVLTTVLINGLTGRPEAELNARLRTPRPSGRRSPL